MLCIHDEMRPLGTFESCQFVLLGHHFSTLFGNKIAYTKRITSRYLVFFCRIKTLKNGHFALTFFQKHHEPVSESKVVSGKPKRKHCSKLISEKQEEKENSKKSTLF